MGAGSSLDGVEITREPGMGGLLDLSHRGLTQRGLSTAIPNLNSVKQTIAKLLLFNNQLHTLAPIVSLEGTLVPCMQRLRWLDISFNKLRSLPVELGQLPFLEYLDVGYNNIEEFPREILLSLTRGSEQGHSVKLKRHLDRRLTLEEPAKVNQWNSSEDEGYFRSRREGGDEEVPDEEQLPQGCLQVLIARYNKFTDGSFPDLPVLGEEEGQTPLMAAARPSSMSTSGTAEDGFERHDEKLCALRVLDLSGNELTKLPALARYNQLEELHLQHNKIEKLKGLQHASARLALVDVSYNCLEVLPQDRIVALPHRTTNLLLLKPGEKAPEEEEVTAVEGEEGEEGDGEDPAAEAEAPARPTWLPSAPSIALGYGGEEEEEEEKRPDPKTKGVVDMREQELFIRYCEKLEEEGKENNLGSILQKAADKGGLADRAAEQEKDKNDEEASKEDKKDEEAEETDLSREAKWRKHRRDWEARILEQEGPISPWPLGHHLKYLDLHNQEAEEEHGGVLSKVSGLWSAVAGEEEEQLVDSPPGLQYNVYYLVHWAENLLTLKLSHMQLVNDSFLEPLEVKISYEQPGSNNKPDDVLHHLHNLTELDLSFNDIQLFPDGIAKLSKLKRLVFSHNFLKKCDQINRLGDIEHLDLSHNEIVGVPVDIAHLTSLRRLLLQKNRLRALPITVRDLVALQELNLNSNLLKTLPYELGALYLETFTVFDNEALKDPPKDIQAQGSEAILAWMRARIRKRKAASSLSTEVLRVEIFGRRGVEIGCVVVDPKTTLSIVRERINLEIDDAPDRYTFMYENVIVPHDTEEQQMAMVYCVGGATGMIMLRDDTLRPTVDQDDKDDKQAQTAKSYPIQIAMVDQLRKMNMFKKFEFTIPPGGTHQVFTLE